MKAPLDHVELRPPRRKTTRAGNLMIALIFISPILSLFAIAIALWRTP